MPGRRGLHGRGASVRQGLRKPRTFSRDAAAARRSREALQESATGLPRRGLAKSSSFSETVSLPSWKRPASRASPLAVALHMVTGDGDQLQRLAAGSEQAGNEGRLASLRTAALWASASALRLLRRPDVGYVGAGTAAECCRSCDEHSRARIDGLRCGRGVDPAVDFQLDVEVLLGDAVGEGLDLLELAGDELLAAEAGLTLMRGRDRSLPA